MDSRTASERDLALLAGNLDRWGPVQDWIGVSIAQEKDSDQIVGK